jgi:hypothetical protein
VRPLADRVLLAAASLILAALPAAAHTARFLRPGPHGRLSPGQIIEVEWPADAVVHAADEMELVLSLDDGRTFPLRVTGNLPRGTTRAAWRVPALRAPRARLALRAGEGEDESESEAIRVMSDVFEILPGDSPSAEELLPLRGEWRTREAVELPEREEPSSSALAGETSVSAIARLEDAGVPSRPPNLNAPGGACVSSRNGGSESPRPADLRPTLPRRPPLPLRI